MTCNTSSVPWDMSTKITKLQGKNEHAVDSNVLLNYQLDVFVVSCRYLIIFCTTSMLVAWPPRSVNKYTQLL